MIESKGNQEPSKQYTLSLSQVFKQTGFPQISSFSPVIVPSKEPSSLMGPLTFKVWCGVERLSVVKLLFLDNINEGTLLKRIDG